VVLIIVLILKEPFYVGKLMVFLTDDMHLIICTPTDLIFLYTYSHPLAS
jgi:hypothetical protein